MEEKVKELETRLEKLEKIEKRRKTKNTIVLCIYAAILILIVIGAISFYLKIKPYKEKLDNLTNWGSSLIKKDEVIDGSDNGIDFGGFDTDDFFNNFFNW